MRLTRYLYNTLEVKHNVLLSIFRHQKEATLFWVSELFYSGLEEELKEILLNTFENCYENDKILREHLRTFKKKILSKVVTTRLCAYATFASTMCYHKFDLSTFVKKYFEIDVVQQEYTFENHTESLIEIKKENIKQYIPEKNDHNWKILKNVCAFPINKEYAKIFTSEFQEYGELKQLLSNKWLYFCKETPIWKTRIEECDGSVDDEREVITFEDDDNFDEFYSKWNYEPDEQPVSVMNTLIGPPTIQYKTLQDFLQEFHLTEVIENYIALNATDKQQPCYYQTKCQDILVEWFKSNSNETTEVELLDNSVNIAHTNQTYPTFPIAKLHKKYIWQTKQSYVDDLINSAWLSKFNNMKDVTEENIKDISYIEDPLATIDLVVYINKRFVGFDIVYPGYENVPKKKIELLNKCKVTDYYQIKAEWILSKSKHTTQLDALKLL
jgi:hypothetical protein|uniref:Uncharacterized protein n=1 Tax=viral metagenome TaxID=1070528 RepID=A0A6C0ISQ7_9ZZZZ